MLGLTNIGEKRQMIVKDKMLTIVKADEIANQLLKIIKTESSDFSPQDQASDPSEQIYLGVHIMGNLLAKMCELLEGYGLTYTMDTITKTKAQDWIHFIANEHFLMRENK
jgi:hypothetical protein